MILTKEQINRYLRQVIIPEISGAGQKKLLDASIILKAESADASAPLLYYLAAAGIGRISCVFQNEAGFQQILDNLRDLNHDTCIALNDDNTPADRLTVKIVYGSAQYVADTLTDTVGKGAPTIMAVNQGWKGYLQVIKPGEQMLASVTALQTAIPQWINSNNPDKAGNIFSTCLLGTLISLEAVKLALNIGTSVESLLSFDLLTMNFDYHKINEPIRLNSGNFLLDGGFLSNQDSTVPGRLSDSKVLIVGLGGLGAPAAYALARAGVGTIGLVDHDMVSISDLNRQIIHSESRLGWPKVDSAETFLQQLNPEVKLIKYHTDLNKDNACEIFAGYDAIIDGVDNFPTRYLINDTCFLMKKPMIEAGVLRFDGIGMTVIPGTSMCYRCLFPEIPAPGSVPSCAEAGVLGPVPGVMGFIQACETVKLLTGKGTLLMDTLLAFEAQDLQFDVIRTGKSTGCPICGSNPSITQLQDYKFVCNL